MRAAPYRGGARAATFTVNTIATGNDTNPGDGNCSTLAGPNVCSLNAASRTTRSPATPASVSSAPDLSTPVSIGGGGGCSCDVSGSGSNGGAWLMLALLLLIFRARPLRN